MGFTVFFAFLRRTFALFRTSENFPRQSVSHNSRFADAMIVRRRDHKDSLPAPVERIF